MARKKLISINKNTNIFFGARIGVWKPFLCLRRIMLKFWRNFFNFFFRTEIDGTKFRLVSGELTQSSGVNFNNILRAAFCTIVLWTAFSLYLPFDFIILWQNNIVAKGASKMLVKLTTTGLVEESVERDSDWSNQTFEESWSSQFERQWTCRIKSARICRT